MKIGDKFPEFKLLDKDSVSYSLKTFKEKFLVIFFYPKDSTPGCTIESKGFSKMKEKFAKLDTALIGISGGDQKTKAKFCKNSNLETVMLSDTDFKLSSELGIYGEKSFMGRKYMGINRITYLLDEKRKVIAIFDSVKPLGHPEEVLRYIKEHS